MTIAYDGQMDKKLAIQHDYDLIIKSIILLKLSGLKLCKEIRVIKPKILIFMLTALEIKGEKAEGFDAGAIDYLVKPFDFRELHVRIRFFINFNVDTSKNRFIQYLKKTTTYKWLKRKAERR